jgi:hypothetical protein
MRLLQKEIPSGVLEWHSRGQGFDSPRVQHLSIPEIKQKPLDCM